MRLFADEDVQLLPQDQDFKILVIAGEMGNAEKINKGRTELCQKGIKHVAIFGAEL